MIVKYTVYNIHLKHVKGPRVQFVRKKCKEELIQGLMEHFC